MAATLEKSQPLQLQTNQAVRVRSLWGDAWQRLIKNKLAVGGLSIVLVFLFLAFFGRYLTPYDFLAQDLNHQL